MNNTETPLQSAGNKDPRVEQLLSLGVSSRQYGAATEDLESVATLKALRIRSGIQESDSNETKIMKIRQVLPNLSDADTQTISDAISVTASLPVLEQPLRDAISIALENEAVERNMTTLKRQFFMLVIPICLAGLAYVALKPIFFPPKWVATYYPNKDLRPPFFGVYKEESPNHNWGLEPAHPGLGANNYSVRWESTLTLDEEAMVTFSTVSDDGVRLFIDDKLVLNYWIPQDSIKRTHQEKLSAGQHAIRLEYFEAENGAKIEFDAVASDGVSLRFSIPNGK